MQQTTSFVLIAAAICSGTAASSAAQPNSPTVALEKQITNRLSGHILTNVGVWSSDGRWIVYDVRSDAAGETFDGDRIERVNVDTGEVQLLYKSRHNAHCGVVTASPVDDRVVFIHGPEYPDADWQYAVFHRRGTLVNASNPLAVMNLDARDLAPPYTAGALRGGTHVHTFSGDGGWVSFTYEDHVLQFADATLGAETNQRNVGVSAPIRAVHVSDGHARNHPGTFFTVLVTRTADQPKPGSDEIARAFSDAWIGTNGYVRTNGIRQHRAIAFQGHVVAESGDTVSEVFVVDLPRDVTVASEDGPLEGTRSKRPRPPLGTRQRRVTFTTKRAYPGLQGPRHWLRSSPDGSQIACLMKDDNGIVQLHTVSPNGGEVRQVTHNSVDVGSAFTWDPHGRFIAHTMDGSVCVTVVESGRTHVVVNSSAASSAPRPEACVVSPDGTRIAYVRRVEQDGAEWNQIFVASVPAEFTD